MRWFLAGAWAWLMIAAALAFLAWVLWRDRH